MRCIRFGGGVGWDMDMDMDMDMLLLLVREGRLARRAGGKGGIVLGRAVVVAVALVMKVRWGIPLP